MAADQGIFLARPDEPPPGIPLAVKDLLDTAGLTTTYGSAVFADHVPARTATAVARLEAAGYGVVGKANLHEFAFGVTSLNEAFGPVPNPLAPGRIAGGSSGGSAAALAAGLADAALGTDSGGSIRIPAACCGVVGFKPTHGLVPTDGCFPLAPSFDHVGPMARSVHECAAMLEVLAPGLPARTPPGLADLAVGVSWLDDADRLVRERVAAAAGHFRRPRTIDLPRPADLEDAFDFEVAEVHRELVRERRERYGPSVLGKIEACLEISPEDAARSAAHRAPYMAHCLEAIEDLDLVVLPTLTCVAPRVEDADLVTHVLTRLTFAFDVLGWPALAIPCGPAEDGLPASLQIVGRPGDDALVLSAGAELERALAPLQFSPTKWAFSRSL
jgi:aspartyl-tRNA(Asn)/glutamyl-tRNA(Gln) amidotransferase subunit A